jgi:hypothetical protein
MAVRDLPEAYSGRPLVDAQREIISHPTGLVRLGPLGLAPARIDAGCCQAMHVRFAVNDIDPDVGDPWITLRVLEEFSLA